jgi:hypothetical protein
MRATRLRRTALFAVALTASLQLCEAWAQSPGSQRTAFSDPSIAQAGGLEGTGGLPENTVPGTSLPVYSSIVADQAGKILGRMRDAAAKCDRVAYDAALSDWNYMLRTISESSTVSSLHFIGYGPAEQGAGAAKQNSSRAGADRASLGRFQGGEEFPTFPPSCAPPVLNFLLGPGSLWFLGGGVIAMNGTGGVTGVDTFLGPGAYQIDNRPVSGAQGSPPFGGVRGRAEIMQFIVNSFFSEAPGGRQVESCGGAVTCGGSSLGIFFEAGVQSAFGSNSFVQNFTSINNTPQALGQQTVSDNFQIPILLGLSIPVFEARAKSLPFFLDLYAGITLDSWTQSLSGRELGAPAGPGFNATNNRLTVDPTLGIGLRTAWGDLDGDGVPDLMWGISTEFQFRPGSVVIAPSPNFRSETYYGTVDPRVGMLIMGRVGFAFGRR